MTYQSLVILLLALAGGSVDAVVLLGFSILTAAQTGNTILLAVSLAKGHFATGFYSAVSIIGYSIGAAAGELIIVRCRDLTSRLTPFGWTLLAELFALSSLLIYWWLAGPNPPVAMIAVLAAFAAIAMGIQSVAAQRFHIGSTTYVTGTLTTFITKTIRRLHLIETAIPLTQMQQDPGSVGPLSSDLPWIYGVTWLVYAGGALISGLLFLRFGAIALALPIATIVIVIWIGTRRP